MGMKQLQAIAMAQERVLSGFHAFWVLNIVPIIPVVKNTHHVPLNCLAAIRSEKYGLGICSLPNVRVLTE
jgi:hypothetical protein